MPKDPSSKIVTLRDLLKTVVANTKKGMTSSKECSLMKQALTDTLGRRPTKEELASVRYD